MRKILLLLLICAAITFNTACSKSNSPQDNSISTNQTEGINESETVAANDASEENSEAEAESGTEAEEQSQDKTEATPTVKPEVKPTPKPETKPSPKPEVKPQPKPETKPDPEVKPEPETKPDDNILAGELKGIIEKIYSLSQVQLPKTAFTEVTSSNSKYYLGIENMQLSEALASEPLISSSAHSVVLLRVNNDSDIDKIKADIKSNVDPRKWICVGVAQEDVIVDNIDNLIILIMDRESDKLHEAFLSLAK